MTEEYVGIDISKDTLDICVLSTKKQWTQKNTPAGIAATLKDMEELNPKLIVMEATGGMETNLVATLSAHGLPVVVVNPRRVRDFAKAMDIFAKTDKIDAGIIALFAKRMSPPIRPLPSEEVRELKELLLRRDQLIEMRTAESNRKRMLTLHQTSHSIAVLIETIDKEIASLERELKRRIKKSPVWCTNEKLVKSVPGVSDITAFKLLASLPELGTLNRKQIAKLAGLAPMNRDSGKHKGKRKIIGGRRVVRTALYMATLSAIRFNPIIKSFYKRLDDAGKLFKVAITACMRKLLTILNAIVRDKVPWNYISA